MLFQLATSVKPHTLTPDLREVSDAPWTLRRWTTAIDQPCHIHSGMWFHFVGPPCSGHATASESQALIAEPSPLLSRVRAHHPKHALTSARCHDTHSPMVHCRHRPMLPSHASATPATTSGCSRAWATLLPSQPGASPILCHQLWARRRSHA
jgi:hypothetical protein